MIRLYPTSQTSLTQPDLTRPTHSELILAAGQGWREYKGQCPRFDGEAQKFDRGHTFKSDMAGG
eukprot:6672593-Karenia_brevis.AAC.2